MQVHSIISNTISEDILNKGHLSIRFSADGFSLLLGDQRYNPVVLKSFTNDPAPSLVTQVANCTQWLEDHTLLSKFRGTCSIVVDSLAATVIPEDLFSTDHTRFYLQQANHVSLDDNSYYKKIEGRPFYLVYLVPESITQMASKMECNCNILHPAVCMLSLADQINAADHQRGFCMIEIRKRYLELLVIRNDQLVLLNRYKINSPREAVYHTLNAFKQLDYNLETIPLFYSGETNKESEEILQLKRYIRKITSVPYIIKDIEKEYITANIILAEATRCE